MKKQNTLGSDQVVSLLMSMLNIIARSPLVFIVERKLQTVRVCVRDTGREIAAKRVALKQATVATGDFWMKKRALA